MVNRRDILRTSLGVLSVSTVTSMAGCLGFGDSDDSDGPQPVSDPSESSDEELPDEVEQSVDHLTDSQQEIDSAIRTIEGDLSAFNGMLDTTDSPPEFDYESVRNRSQEAHDSLEEARDGATEGQILLIDDLELVIEGFELLADVLEETENAAEAFAHIEQGIRELDVSRVEEDVVSMSESASAASTYLTTAQETFDDVSEEVLEEAEYLSPGRVNNVFVRLRDASAYIEIVEEAFRELEPAVPALSDVVSAVETDDFSEAATLLPDVRDQIDDAHQIVDGMDEDTAVAYQQDIQSLQCVTSNTSVATEELQTAVEEYQNGNDIDAIEALMDGYDALGQCSYDLLDDVFETIGEDIGGI